MLVKAWTNCHASQSVNAATAISIKTRKTGKPNAIICCPIICHPSERRLQAGGFLFNYAQIGLADATFLEMGTMWLYPRKRR
jgi:hypothetical protein